MATDDPMEPLTKLAKATKAAGEPLGFNQRMFLAEPNLEGGPPRARIVYDIDVEKVGVAPKPADDALEDMWAATEAAEAERRAVEARERLTNLEQTLRDPKKGILDD